MTMLRLPSWRVHRERNGRTRNDNGNTLSSLGLITAKLAGKRCSCPLTLTHHFTNMHCSAIPWSARPFAMALPCSGSFLCTSLGSCCIRDRSKELYLICVINSSAYSLGLISIETPRSPRGSDNVQYVVRKSSLGVSSCGGLV